MGPRRDCAHAITFRSISTRNVTETSSAFSRTAIFKRGITKLSNMRVFLAVYLTENDINGTDQRNDVRYEVAFN